MQLNDSQLFRQQAYLNGEWINADSQATLAVTNPADHTLLGTVPNLGTQETVRAIEAAQAALPAWRAQTAKTRSQLLRRWYELIVANQDDLAALITAEQGKPLAEAKGEILYGASFIEWFAEEAKRIYGDVIPAPKTTQRVLVLKQPIGVVAAITPWNFPNAMITRKCAPALAVGCPIVLKPAESTPFSALALAELAERAGFPKGVINIVTGDPQPIGAVLTSHPEVRKLSFTGSTATGKLLMTQAASTVKKLSLELGGNAPFIVFNDADLALAVEGALASKYRNTGQTCVCANRLLVQAEIYEDFANALTAAVKKMVVGPGHQAGVQQGPLINEAAVAKVEAHIADARSKGGTIRCGGNRHALGGTFFEPTVITEVTPDMRVAQEETFGPVAPLFCFKTEAEGIQLANNTQYGLAAYFYTRDLARAWRVAEALEYGIVGVNEGLTSNEAAPFGGIKESGIGREGSKYGVDEFLELKYVCMGAIN